MSRVLVTGASGFVGRRVLPLLVAAGHEVHAVSRGRDRGGHGVTWHGADVLRDPVAPVAAARPEVLVHLAWVTEHGAFWTAPENVQWVEASLALMRAFVARGGARVVMAGTCAEYDWTTGATVLAEDAPVVPATLYGAAKAGLRQVAQAYAAQEGVGFTWGRVFFPYGPGEEPGRLVASVARALLAGEPAETSEGTQVRDFIHVDDVARAFAALAGSTVAGAVNIGTGQGVRIRDVVDMIGAAAGRPDLLRPGAVPMRPGDPPSIVADATRLIEELGFRPSVALEDGLATAVESWRAR